MSELALHGEGSYHFARRRARIFFRQIAQTGVVSGRQAWCLDIKQIRLSSFLNLGHMVNACRVGMLSFDLFLVES